MLSCNSRPDVKVEQPTAAMAEPKISAPNPFYDEEDAEAGDEPASGALRYRRWALGKDTQVVVRTSVHAVSRKKGPGAASSLLKLFTLNEWDSKAPGAPADWRKVIDNTRGNVLATEMKNTGFKLAKFTAQSLLSGVDALKLGFVSRAARSDPDQHQVIGVSTLTPQTFAQQMSLNPGNMWGIVRWIVDLVRKHAANLQSAETGAAGEGEDKEDGDAYMAKFVLLRDPNFPRLYLYNVPLEAFEGEDGDDGEDEEGWTEAPGGAAGAAAGASEGGPALASVSE